MLHLLFWLFDLTQIEIIDIFLGKNFAIIFRVKQIDRVVNTSIYKNIKLKVFVARKNMKQLYQSYFKKEGFIGSS